MTDLRKVKTSLILGSARFWVIVIVLYLMTKNFSEEQIFHMIGVYYLISIAFEYPTGVVGDYFSHKISVFLGYLITTIALLFLVFVTSLWQMTLFYVVFAVGVTLISGSDTALLHSVSKNFKNDLSQVRMFSVIVSAVALSIGGWMGSIDLRIPFYLSATFLIIAALLLITTGKQKQEKVSGNIFATANEGLKEVLSNKILFHILIVSSVFSSLHFNLKWFYNPFFLSLGLKVEHWGTFVYKRISEINIIISFIIAIIVLLMFGMTNLLTVSIIGFLFVHFVRGFLATKLIVDIIKLGQVFYLSEA